MYVSADKLTVLETFFKFLSITFQDNKTDDESSNLVKYCFKLLLLNTVIFRMYIHSSLLEVKPYINMYILLVHLKHK